MQNNTIAWLRAACIITAATAGVCGCNSFFSPDKDDEHGEIVLGFEREMYLQTKATTDLPDTNDFILTVKGSSGSVIYNGSYGAAPLSIFASPGTYTVSAVSGTFKAPAWSSPQYGDTQTVTVKASESARIPLLCRQLNAGVRLNISPEFLTAYPAGSLHLKSDDGKLLYSYTERRIAYFNPGIVELILSNGGTDQTLLRRTLSQQEILTVNVKVASGSSASPAIGIQVDTTRHWTSLDYTIGQGSQGSGQGRGDAISVAEARSRAGSTGIWVYGYIVGGDLSSASASFSAPFSSRTNMVIAPKASVTDKSLCMSVQLKTGAVRDALNLVDNPQNIGHKIYLKGDIVAAYFGIPGIQNISDYYLD